MTNYASDSDVQARLLNANLGASGAQICTDTQIDDLLQEADDIINFELDITTNTTDSAFTPILKKIAVDLVSMAILRGRHYKENNQVDSVDRFWTITPEPTREHLRKLRQIKQRLRSRSAMLYNMNDGKEVNLSQ